MNKYEIFIILVFKIILLILTDKSHRWAKVEDLQTKYNRKKDPLETQHPMFENSRLY